MNKNYLFILIAVAAIVLVVMAYSMTATLSLDQIIKNKDCVALDKWENEHMFDDNLNIPSDQLSSAMKLAAECVGKALKNMSGSSDSKTNEYLDDRNKDTALVKEIISDRDCWAIKDLLDSGEINSEMLKIVAGNFRTHCDKKAIINDEGIDISNTYKLNSFGDYILK